MADVFTERAIITLYSATSGKSLAVHEGMHGGLPFGEGGDGEFARWEVDVDDKKSDSKTKVVRLARKREIDQNKRSTSYLRIYPNDRKQLTLDGVGGGGEFCYFRVHAEVADNWIQLESVAFPNHYLAVSGDGKAHWVDRILPGVNFMATLADDNPFDNKTVVRLTVPSTGKCVRIMDGKDAKNGMADVNGNGGTGDFAKFIVHPLGQGTIRLESFKYQSDNKHFLRILNNNIDGSGGEGPNTILTVRKVRPGVFTFESKAHPGQYLGINTRGGDAVITDNASREFLVARIS